MAPAATGRNVGAKAGRGARMNEYWLCNGCGSMVRRNASKCYKCGRPRPAVTHALAVVRDRTAAPLMPGVDDDLRDAARTTLARHRYRPVGMLAVLVIVALGVLLGVEMIRFWSVQGLHLLEGHDSASYPGLAATLDRVATVGRAVEPVVGLMAGALWLIFLSVSLLNAPALGSGTAATTWFEAGLDCFIPVLNLWRPYQTVRDLYVRLAVPGSTGSWVVGAWWASCLVWFAVTYGPIYLQGIEIFIAIGGAIFVFIYGAGQQPAWNWLTPPLTIVTSLVVVSVLGPTWIFFGNNPIPPFIGVSGWAHTLPGVYLIDDLLGALGRLEWVGFVAFTLGVVFLIWIAVEIAERQRLRMRWLVTSTRPARAAIIDV
jgi:hypothetical protein